MGDIPWDYVWYWNPCWGLSRVSSLPSSTPIIGVYAFQFRVFDVEQSTNLTLAAPPPRPRGPVSEAQSTSLTLAALPQILLYSRLWAGRMRIYFVDCGPAECAHILSIVGRQNTHIFCRLWAGGMRIYFVDCWPAECADGLTIPMTPLKLLRLIRYNSTNLMFRACHFHVTLAPILV